MSTLDTNADQNISKCWIRAAFEDISSSHSNYVAPYILQYPITILSRECNAKGATHEVALFRLQVYEHQ